MLARTKELQGMGIGVKHLSVGNKITKWLEKRQDNFDYMGGQAVGEILNSKKTEEEQGDALSSMAEEVY